MLSLAARESAGGGESGEYLPVRTPCASGDQTIWEIPFRAQSGITSRSGSRRRIEYCGWLETNLSTSGRSSEAWICSALHSLKPR